MTKKIDVLGIGNAIMDVIVPVSDQALRDHDITKGGMTLIDERRAVSLHTSLTKLGVPVEAAGGSAANTLVGIAELGAKGAYIGKVAKDAVGTRFTKGLMAAGLDYGTSPAQKGPASARCIIAVTPDGERSMSTFLGASSGLSPQDIKKTDIAAAQTIYLEGYLFDSKTSQAAFVKAAKLAREANAEVALTLSDSFCVNMHRENFQNLVDNHVDILFANEDELLALYEKTDFDKAVKTLKKHCKTACITRGSKGSIILNKGQIHNIPAVSVDKVVDTTGAGDQYAAGILAGRAFGMDWEDAGYLGSLCASEVISHYGPRPETSIHTLAMGITH